MLSEACCLEWIWFITNYLAAFSILFSFQINTSKFGDDFTGLSWSKGWNETFILTLCTRIRNYKWFWYTIITLLDIILAFYQITSFISKIFEFIIKINAKRF